MSNEKLPTFTSQSREFENLVRCLRDLKGRGQPIPSPKEMHQDKVLGFSKYEINNFRARLREAKAVVGIPTETKKPKSEMEEGFGFEPLTTITTAAPSHNCSNDLFGSISGSGSGSGSGSVEDNRNRIQSIVRSGSFETFEDTMNGSMIQQIIRVEYVCLSGMSKDNTTIKLLEGGRTLRVSFELPDILFDQKFAAAMSIEQNEIVPYYRTINEAPRIFFQDIDLGLVCSEVTRVDTCDAEGVRLFLIRLKIFNFEKAKNNEK